MFSACAQIGINGWLPLTESGALLDDRASFGLLSEIIRFETPDGRMITVPAYRAGELAAQYSDRYGVSVRFCDGAFVIEMDDWASPADTSAAA